MKPVQSSTTQIDTLPGKEVNFRISQANSAWIMRSLADLYSNRELAVVREYSTNARDAMIEAGKADEPIIITLPTMNNPTFIVQDFGVGMTALELDEVYAEFGESTKRDSDEYNGLLGFGSKSAVAYTNTFTVTSVKNHCKNIAVVTRSEDKMGGYIIKMKFVIENMETHEENGTKIEVPVHNHAEFARKAKDFYRFWKPGTVLVDGVEPEWAVGDKLDEGLFISNAGASYVVMGNVAYPIANPDVLFPRGMNKITFVAYVPNGTVEFTPNREALKYSEHTKNALHKIITDFCDTAVQRAKDEIANAKTHWEAFNAWDTWNKIVGVNNVPELFFKGEKLSEIMMVKGWAYDSNAYRYSTSEITKFGLRKVHNTLFITHFGTSVSSGQKAKAREYAKLKDIKAQYYVFTSGDVSSPWVDPGRVVTWDALKLALPPKPKVSRPQSTAPGRLAGSFDLITALGRSVEQAVPDTKDLYFVTVQEYNGQRSLSDVLTEFGLKHEVVLVPANRQAKFLRFYPHAKPIWPLLESLVILDGKSLLSPDALAYLELTPNSVLSLRALKPNRIDDPVLKEHLRIIAESETTYLQKYNKHEQLARMLGLRDKFIAYPKVRNRYDRRNHPFEAYPLTNTSTRYLEHTYLYINAVYAARKAGKAI